MSRLYQGLLQDTLDPSAALRKAQLALRAIGKGLRRIIGRLS
jgi:hypothetical protein